MANYERNPMSGYGERVQTRVGADTIDQGLRSYMLTVYNYMAIALALSGLAAIGGYMMAVTADPSGAVAQLPNGAYLTEFGRLLFVSPLKWVVILAPLAMVFFLSMRIHKMSVSSAQTTFWIYSALVGLSLSSLFLVYAHGSIARVFFITAA
ncbi:MAG: Bax inhibitor-1 family protein, partial [Hyphomicrobiales bacterium]|nr:Bax inhibitor-1 family protein [Hyphomicrobiales bacterium]